MLEIGSIWRKWDFHVHTPFSELNNNFGDSEKEETWNKYVKELVKKAISDSISVIFLTDYFMVDGYEKVLSILNDESKVNKLFEEEIRNDVDYTKKIKSICFYPNIEFRMNNQVDGSKIQYHVLFSNEIKPELIKEHFLKHLYVEVDGQKYYLSPDEMKLYGERCKKAGIGVGVGGSSLRIGLNCAYIELKEAVSILENDALFKGKYLFVAAEEDTNHISWEGQAGSLRRLLYSKADARFSASPSDVNWGTTQECVDTIGHKLPSLWGSDSHEYETLLSPRSNHYCWIKADTTFKGLIDSLMISEDRVFIGSMPNDLINQNSRNSYSIKQLVVFSNNEDAKQHWINASIPLNPSMVSIIGNKGSGKSALSDIIGYLGNSNKYPHFSFLTFDRFFDKSNAYAKDYLGKLVFFNSNESDEIEIRYKAHDDASPELVTYLPQRYIEKTCNQVDKRYFTQEINTLIFSYLDDVEKEGFDNLNDLIESKVKEIDNKIAKVRNELSELNAQIVKKERMKTIKYRKELEVSKKEIEKKIENHQLSRPVEVPKPELNEESPLVQLYAKCDDLLEEIKHQHREQFSLYKIKEKELLNIQNVNGRVKELKQNVQDINSLYRDHFAEYDNKMSFSVDLAYENYEEFKEYCNKLSANYSSIKETLLSNENEIKHFDLATADFDSVKSSIEAITRFTEKEETLTGLLNDISNAIGEEQSIYQKYQEEIKKWTDELLRLQDGAGEEQKDGSLKGVNEKIDYVQNQLQTEIDNLCSSRTKKIVELYKLLEEKKEILKELYRPVQAKLDFVLRDDNERVTFDCRIIADSRLATMIDEKINHRVASKFKDFSSICELIEGIDFNDGESVSSFVQEIYSNIDSETDLFYSTLLKDSESQKEFYDFLSNLNYLNVEYSLKMNNKMLEQLSPGEKGIVLLIFYLALDKNNKPLVIDQPEDNLDNESIYKRLTTLIKFAKQNRQIIVVTHNPNIAVACDSEQVIYASINQDTNVITYESGSIENPLISKHIVDVLEGTMPAFNYRESKYIRD